MKIGNKEFSRNKMYIMGILNVTPDSFSDGGKYNTVEKALSHTGRMIDEGASIIDVGGESTRPGYTILSEEEELERVLPVIYAIKENYDIPVSIDTYKSKVAGEALKAGADMVNDIWGLKYDKNMASLIAKYDCPCCLMHNRKKADYKNFLDDFMNDMTQTINMAKSAGIKDSKIILDPGIGFGKTYENNLEIISNVDILNKFGYPILFASSRKSVIGLTLDLPSNQRVEGTIATTVISAMKGCNFVRVHDIKENKRAIDMVEAVMRY